MRMPYAATARTLRARATGRAATCRTKRDTADSRACRRRTSAARCISKRALDAFARSNRQTAKADATSRRVRARALSEWSARARRVCWRRLRRVVNMRVPAWARANKTAFWFFCRKARATCCAARHALNAARASARVLTDTTRGASVDWGRCDSQGAGAISIAKAIPVRPRCGVVCAERARKTGGGGGACREIGTRIAIETMSHWCACVQVCTRRYL
jgi:hypothetical protein